MKKVILFIILCLSITSIFGCESNPKDTEVDKMVSLLSKDADFTKITYNVSCETFKFNINLNSYGVITKEAENYKLVYHYEYLNSLDSNVDSLVSSIDKEIVGTLDEIISGSENGIDDYISTDIVGEQLITPKMITDDTFEITNGRAHLSGKIERNYVSVLMPSSEDVKVIQIDIYADEAMTKLDYYTLSYETDDSKVLITITIE